MRPSTFGEEPEFSGAPTIHTGSRGVVGALGLLVEGMGVGRGGRGARGFCNVSTKFGMERLPRRWVILVSLVYVLPIVSQQFKHACDTCSG